mgnify:CR=1 FL=1
MIAFDLSISDAAKELRTRRETVKKLLTSGELVGYVIDPGAVRKSYRITRQALDDFKARRSAKQVATSRPKRAASKPQNQIQYF